MIKNIFILILTIFTIGLYGQETTFQENDNYDARELKQIFKKQEDSLILESESVIRQVDIFNKNFMKSFVVNANVSKIDLSILPLGEFIVQARLGQKRIIMYVFKREAIEEKPIAPVKRSVSRYWVVYEINSGSGSNKMMSLEKKDEVSRLISKNKRELSTKIARDNKLTVYEVYDISKFMREQLRASTYYKTLNSNTFNVKPYYASDSTSIE